MAGHHVRVDVRVLAGPFAVEALEVACASAVACVTSRDFFYWGRRGPSVHLKFTVPAEAMQQQQPQPLEWLYSEVTVPAASDHVGVFAMAGGFAEGYCGLQVNSPSERRVLFSVWSACRTDDPTCVPERQRVALVRSGPGVVVGAFGNEGTGGQSFLVFPWRAGQTYAVMTRVRPAATLDAWGQPGTEFTALFFDPDDGDHGEWRLIATWRRPGAAMWLERPHCFLENFEPSAGHQTREARFGNQWACTAGGRWIPLTAARLTCDETGQSGGRSDFAGGVGPEDQAGFYLKHCGFFDATCAADQLFCCTQPRSAPPAHATTLTTDLA